MTERERNRRHARRARARGAVHSSRIAGLFASLVLLSGCGGRTADQADDQVGDERAQDRAPTSEVPIVEPPPGVGSDGLANLPVASSTSSLLVPGYRYDSDDDTDPYRSLLLLDLADQVVVDIPNHAEFGAVGFTTDGDAIWAAGERTLGLRDASSGATSTIQLPEEIDGTIGKSPGSLQGVDELISVTLDQTDSSSQTVLLSGAGSLRCAGPEGTVLTAQGRYLWSDDARTRIDPATCEIAAGLSLPAGQSAEALRVRETTAYVALSGPDDHGTTTSRNLLGTVRQFDVATGRQSATSPSIPMEDPELVLLGDGVWVLSAHKLTRLDATTLEIVAVTPLPAEVVECDGWPRLVPQAGRLFLLDECTAILFLLDPETGAPTSGWRLPSPGESDFEITEIPNEEGIWMVDFDQSQLPFLFDAAEQRFERPPISPPAGMSILASDFAVHSEPTFVRRPAPSPTPRATTDRPRGHTQAGAGRPE